MNNTIGISLGWKCATAATSIQMGLRTTKENGYKTCPFDMCFTNYLGIIECIKDNFKYLTDSDYLKIINSPFKTGTLKKNEKLIYHTKYKFIFNHESPGHFKLYKIQKWENGRNHFIDNDFLLFKERYNRRIINFKEYINTNNIHFIIARHNKDISKLKNIIDITYPKLKYTIEILDPRKQGGIGTMKQHYTIMRVNEIDINTELYILKSMLCVTGYWNIKSKIKSKNYLEHFKKTLPLQCDFVFFGNNEKLINKLIKRNRPNLNTKFINLNINEFKTYKYYNKYPVIKLNKHKVFINNKHCPSIELFCIWMEKINLLKITKNNNPNYEWYCWYDSGLSRFRERELIPQDNWPNNNKLHLLEKDKINCDVLNTFVKATAFILHRDFIDIFHKIFYKKLRELINSPFNWKYGFTDQYILSMIYKDEPELFNIVGTCFGEIISKLE